MPFDPTGSVSSVASSSTDSPPRIRPEPRSARVRNTNAFQLPDFPGDAGPAASRREPGRRRLEARVDTFPSAWSRSSRLNLDDDDGDAASETSPSSLGSGEVGSLTSRRSPLGRSDTRRLQARLDLPAVRRRAVDAEDDEDDLPIRPQTARSTSDSMMSFQTSLQTVDDLTLLRSPFGGSSPSYSRGHTSHAGAAVIWEQSCRLYRHGLDPSAVVARPGLFGYASAASAAAVSSTAREGVALLAKVPATVLRHVTAMRELTPPQALSTPGSPSSSISERPRTGLRERPSKASFAPPVTSSTGFWRPVDIKLRDNGHLLVTSEGAAMHRVSLGKIPATDIRLVDPSVFGMPHCISIKLPGVAPSSPAGELTRSMSISRSASSFMALAGLSRSLPPDSTSGPTASMPVLDGHLYFALDVQAQASALYAMLKTVAAVDPLPPLAPQGSEEPPTPPHRLWRAIQLTIVEGRGVGETVRPTDGTPSYFDHASLRASGSSVASNDGHGWSQPRTPAARGDGPRERTSSTDPNSVDTLAAANVELSCEIVVDNVVMARTATLKGTSMPVWREHFAFGDLGPLKAPLVVRLYSTPLRKGQAVLIGSIVLECGDGRRGHTVEGWFPILSPTSVPESVDVVGELYITLRVEEQVVFEAGEYQTMRELLTDETTMDAAYDLMVDVPNVEFERIADLLNRIYLVDGILVRCMSQMAAREITADVEPNILFRGKSLLTKSLESYMRLVATSGFLAKSVGDVVRSLVESNVGLEIDPAKVEPKRSADNDARELLRWTSWLWQSIYQARSSCPSDLRIVFTHIRQTVERQFGPRAETMRFTAVSAFLVLRFFVPALLHPKLFGLAPAHPQPRCQRTLTLMAKALMGLANLSESFGQKEPWMAAMDPFLRDNRAAFIDYIGHIATPGADSTTDWTSSAHPLYARPAAERAKLPSLVRDRVPTLPHLTDGVKDLAVLAGVITRMRRAAEDREYGFPRARGAPLSEARAARLAALIEAAEAIEARASAVLALRIPPADDALLISPPYTPTASPRPIRRSSQVDVRSLDGDAGSPSRSRWVRVSPRSRAQTVSAGRRSRTPRLSDEPSSDADAVPSLPLAVLDAISVVSSTGSSAGTDAGTDDSARAPRRFPYFL